MYGKRHKERAFRNGNQYLTHAVGPAAKWLNINRGDRFEYLVSMGGRSVGLNHYAEKTLGLNHPFAHKEWPLNLIHRIQGTKGMVMGTVDGIYLEDKSPSKQKL